ncbi:polysaccharide deacetylase family protein [Streptomyces glaucus]|uniref:Polysaccharide deacetylase family protein n=1 Tax=Streptomyces glaucus TaxID=284029 RepID=A0ABN3J4S1_9ACTN
MRPRRAATGLLAAAALTAALTACGTQPPTAARPGGDAAHGHRPGGAREPAARGTGLPPVVDRVPTRDRVVFLTYDDGAERDPRFVDLVRARRLPVTMFLTDSVAGPAYGHFARLRAVGASLQNHTLDHPFLRGLPYAGQRAEICGQQDKLKSRFGVRPHLFRPPYGAYDTATLRAAADCGITAVVLWRASVTGTGELAYARGAPRLRPGDIVAVDPDEPTGLSLLDRTRRLLGEIEEQGLRVGRLEDHVRIPGRGPRTDARPSGAGRGPRTDARPSGAGPSGARERGRPGTEPSGNGAVRA